MAEKSPFLTGARLQGAAMIAVLAVGFGLGAATLSRPGPQKAVGDTLTAKAFLGGQTAAAVNHAMAHDLPIGPALSAAGGVLRWRLFGSGGPQVSVGCHDWLYLTEELRPWPDNLAAMHRRADTLHQAAASLAKQGIDLVVVLVPDKARVQTADTCGVPYSAQSQVRLDVFGALLGGLHVVDLYPTYRAAGDRPLYYRTDTHWNQDGAALAAETVAKSVTTGIDRSHHFATTAGPAADRPGDLLRLMSLESVPDLALPLRPLPDREAPETTTQTDAPAEGGSLLDDAPVAEVVLLGSSYSVNANFHGRLEQALGAPIGQFAQAGGAFWGSARDYLRSQAYTETPPKLIIWEIPERVVNQPIEAEEAAFLKTWPAE